MNLSSGNKRGGRAAAQAAELALDDRVAGALRGELPRVAEAVVAAIVSEVPAYDAPFQGRMGSVIEQAVRVSLDSFVAAASRDRSPDDGETTIGVGVQAAEDLGRAEARAGRPVEALLSAYRVGARVSWREVSRMAVALGTDAATLGRVAEVIFSYIDELSAASVAGHNAETQTVERARMVHLDRLTRGLLTGAPEPELTQDATGARWTPPRTLTAVLVPRHRLETTAGMVDPRTLTLAEDLPHAAGTAAPTEIGVLLVPDAGGPARARLLQVLAGRSAIVGPARPWTRASSSYARTLRGLSLPRRSGSETDSALVDGSVAGPVDGPVDGPIDTETRLAELVLQADPSAAADLREAVLAPFADLPEATAERLAETLRLWLLLQGRRELVAQALHVHPQTVRYRMNQVRELFGDRLEDPEEILALMIALSTTGS